ncbi:MAG: enoyl-CoA hydratase/isomerase family protein [Pseudoclavibacter sp.]
MTAEPARNDEPDERAETGETSQHPLPTQSVGEPPAADSATLDDSAAPTDIAALGSETVLVDQRGALGLITLNRPRQINALSHDMVVTMARALAALEREESIRTIAVRGAGERGLCAGGDVAHLATLVRTDPAAAEAAASAFFRDEYELNRAIARCSKPYVALMDGIVLGGGVGVSGHGSHRVVTEGSRVGMPETGIGIFPDVGGTWLLARAPSGLGMLMALTGTAVGSGDAIRAGFADAFVPRDRLERLLTLLETESADDAIAQVRDSAPKGAFDGETGWTDRLDEATSVERAIAAISDAAAAGSAAAAAARDTIATRAPRSLAVTFEAILRAHALPDLEAALVNEYRLMLRMVLAPDFAEGVRAQLIDKDRSPIWNPATLDAVDPAGVAALFEPLELGDLSFDTV